MRKDHPSLEALTAFFAGYRNKPTNPNWISEYGEAAEREFGIDHSDFGDLLYLAQKTHHTYETALGHTDPEWPTWYARFILLIEKATREIVEHMQHMYRMSHGRAAEDAKKRVKEVFATATARHVEHPPAHFAGSPDMSELAAEHHRTFLIHHFSLLGATEETASALVDLAILFTP